MKCTNCSHENRPGVKFCEQCGNQMLQEQAAEATGRFCTNCGQILNPANKFCENCGAAIGEQPQQPAPAPVSSPMGAPVYMTAPPQRKGLRGCIWPFIGIFSGLLFVCGLMFYMTLIRIPPVPHSPSTPAVIVKIVHTLRIVQANSSPPPAVTQIGDQLYAQDPPPITERFQVVIETDPDGNQAVKLHPNPAACGPKLSLETPEITRRQVFFLQEAAGAGPLIYDFENIGDSLSNIEYEYHAEWVMTNEQTGEKTSAIKSCWISNGHLFCYGPDTDAYSYAEMRILSENPACDSSVASFPFDGVNPAPTEDEAWECHDPDEIRNIDKEVGNYFDDDLEFLPDSQMWLIRLNSEYFDTVPYFGNDVPYRLKTEVFDPDFNQWRSYDSDCWSYTSWGVACIGWDPEKFPSLRWSLNSEPVDKCTEPMASGMSGSIVVAEPVSESCIPEGIQSNLQYFIPKMQGRDPGWTPSFDNTFAVHLPSLDDLDNSSLEFYATYDVFNADGVSIESGRKYECKIAVQYGMPCDGPDVEDDQTVNMKVYYANDGCNELIAQKQWAGAEVAQPAEEDRCSLFDDIDMSVVYLDWISGKPLQFYVKMPGGVPGQIENWGYTVEIGSSNTRICDTIFGYDDRLYCNAFLSSDYSNSVRPMALFVDGCDLPIYSVETAFLPEIEESGGGGGSTSSTSDEESDGGGSAGSDGGNGGSGDVCGSEPADSGSGAWSDWCSCRWDNGLSC